MGLGRLFRFEWVAAFLFAWMARAENIVFPADAKVIDVTKGPYFAKGDGRTDDTDALQQALNDNGGRNCIIYLPNGTYRISAPVRWPWSTNVNARYRATILQGQSRDGTQIRLADQASGYQKGNQPRPMIWTGEYGAVRTRSSIRNLTVHTGSHNPMAIGIQYFANKQGCMRDLRVVAGDAGAVVGLDFSKSDENGPCLVQNVRIEGFEFGVRTGFAVYGVVFEHLELVGQMSAGFQNLGQSVSIRDLRSTNRVPAVQNNEANGFVVIVDAVLEGTATKRPPPAIQNKGVLFARNLMTPGYAKSVENRTGTGSDIVGPEVREFLSHTVFNLFPAPQYSLNLPVKETPDVPWDDLKDWAGPGQFGGKPDDTVDDSKAIQDAIDSGKSTVYLPNGTWTLRETVTLRGNVRRLIGCEARIRLDGLKGRPGFVVADGTSPVVVVERLEAESFDDLLLSQTSGRTLVIRDCAGVRAEFPGMGDVFLEDVHASRVMRFNGQNVWARQLCLDHDGPKIVNEKGRFWVLGLTCERTGCLVRTSADGLSEVLGGLCFSSGSWKDEAMFRLEGGQGTFVLPEASFLRAPFMTIVSEKRGTVVRKLSNNSADAKLPLRAGGIALPLYTGHGTAVGPVRSAPASVSQTNNPAGPTTEKRILSLPLPGS
ncbi:MAG: endopolygalacturonase [Pedosphaera sp.]|nr:endopolygalacturonase [Pedosphaera sp.]